VKILQPSLRAKKPRRDVTACSFLEHPSFHSAVALTRVEFSWITRACQQKAPQEFFLRAIECDRAASCVRARRFGAKCDVAKRASAF
jgi:hypothetical protein